MLLLACGLLFFSIGFVSSQEMERIMASADEESVLDAATTLNRDLFKNYDAQLSPYNSRTDVNGSAIQIGLVRARLTEVNDRQMEFRSIVGLIQIWEDPRLRWNPADHRNIQYIYVKRSRVWFPEVYPCEASSVDEIQSDTAANVKILANGSVLASVYYSAMFTCEMDLIPFPSDSHNCSYCFSLSGYDPDELTLKPFTPEGFLLEPRGISEWDMSLSDTEAATKSSDVIGTLGMSFVSLVVVPTFLLGSLVLIGVFYGATAENLINNAVQLGLTTMMSMMVVVGILNDSLAKSKSIPTLGEIRASIAANTAEDNMTAFANDGTWPTLISVLTQPLLARNVLFFVFVVLHLLNLYFCVRQ